MNLYSGIFDSLKVKDTTFNIFFDERKYFYYGIDWRQVTKILGDVKGVVSVEDRQLLKIGNNLSDEVVDMMISEYQKQYKLYLKNSKLYGKEKSR